MSEPRRISDGEMEELSLLMGKICLCDNAEDAEIEVSRPKRKNEETEKEQSDTAQPMRKRVRIEPDHGKEFASMALDIHARIDRALNKLLDEQRLFYTPAPSINRGTFPGSPYSVVTSCEPCIEEGVPGSDDSDGVITPPMPLAFPPPGPEGSNKHQVGDQVFPAKYKLTSKPDMWSHSQPPYALDIRDTDDFSDDEYEYEEILPSSESGRGESLAKQSSLTYNVVPRVYNDVYCDSDEELNEIRPPTKRIRV